MCKLFLMKSCYIEIYNDHLRKYRYKESFLLVQNNILYYLKYFLNIILLFCELSFFIKSYYIYIYFRFSILLFLTLLKKFLFIICVYF